MSEVPLCSPRFTTLLTRLAIQHTHHVRVGMYSSTIEAPIPVSRLVDWNPPHRSPLPVSRRKPRGRTYKGQPGKFSLPPRPVLLKRLSLSLSLYPPPRKKVFRGPCTPLCLAERKPVFSLPTWIFLGGGYAKSIIRNAFSPGCDPPLESFNGRAQGYLTYKKNTPL